MTGRDLIKAVQSGKPVQAEGFRRDVTAADYHVTRGRNGTVQAYAGIVDSFNRYRSILLDKVTCRWNPDSVRSGTGKWDGKLKSAELLQMLRNGEPVDAGRRSFRRILGLYVKRDVCGNLIYSAACLDRNGNSVVFLPVRELRKAEAENYETGRM